MNHIYCWFKGEMEETTNVYHNHAVRKFYCFNPYTNDGKKLFNQNETIGNCVYFYYKKCNYHEITVHIHTHMDKHIHIQYFSLNILLLLYKIQIKLH